MRPYIFGHRGASGYEIISTPEGFIIGIIVEVIPIICVTIGAIFLIIFPVKLIRGKD